MSVVVKVDGRAFERVEPRVAASVEWRGVLMAAQRAVETEI